jgi:hypothetical protein
MLQVLHGVNTPHYVIVASVSGCWYRIVHISRLCVRECGFRFLAMAPVVHVWPLNRLGRTIAQAVSRWLPTAAAARVRARVWSSGICGGQSGAGAGFLRVLRFPLPIHSTKFSILTITRGRYNRPINGRRAEWTQFGLHPPYAN